jgi:hypothetical protein
MRWYWYASIHQWSCDSNRARSLSLSPVDSKRSQTSCCLKSLVHLTYFQDNDISNQECVLKSMISLIKINLTGSASATMRPVCVAMGIDVLASLLVHERHERSLPEVIHDVTDALLHVVCPPNVVDAMLPVTRCCGAVLDFLFRFRNHAVWPCFPSNSRQPAAAAAAAAAAAPTAATATADVRPKPLTQVELICNNSIEPQDGLGHLAFSTPLTWIPWLEHLCIRVTVERGSDLWRQRLADALSLCLVHTSTEVRKRAVCAIQAVYQTWSQFPEHGM